MKKICRVCGQEFETKNGRQQDCNKQIFKKCAVCGKEFEAKCSMNDKSATCSKECSNKYASMQRQAAYAKQTRICELCGQEFHPRSNTQKVCERDHFSKCVICGKEFKLNYKSAIGQVDLRKTCSKECLDELNYRNNPFKNPETHEKIRQTMLKKYGVEHPAQNPEVRKKMYATYQARTGYDHPSHNPKTLKGKQLRISSLEKKLMTILDNNQVAYESQKLVSKGDVHHAFDFYLPKYKMYIDVDGVYYHGYLDDSNGEQVNEDRDAIRTYLISDPEIYVVIIESHFEEQVDELLTQLSSIDSSTFNYEQSMFDWCRSIDFPYPQYEDNRLIKDYSKLKEHHADKYNSNVRLGFSTIRQFHKSIFDARVGNAPSIKEAWNDDEIIKKVIKNRMIYKNNVDPYKILSGFYISKIVPKVSVFNPVLAKYLVEKYLNEYNEIFDPFSGFSGRLLGVTACNKHYIGRDLNTQAVNEAQQIIAFHNLNAEVSCHNILTAQPESYNCILTCPPYYNKEIYSTETEFKTCDEWIEIVLNKYNCEKYVFVVDKTKQFNQYVQEELITKSHFNATSEKVIVIENT